jgi:flavin reductase (DIM6/NTAB) family NADH-FMN oxidoreductase RutF
MSEPTSPEKIQDLAKAVYWLTQPAMVVTAAANGKRNLMFAVRGMHYLDQPASITIGVAKDSVTGTLIRESGEFGVNCVAGDQAWLLAKGRELSRVSSTDVDKFELFGVETFAGDVIAAPLIVGCTANLECKVRATHDNGDGYYLVVGDIAALHGFPSRAPMAMFRQAAYSLDAPIQGTSR